MIIPVEIVRQDDPATTAGDVVGTVGMLLASALMVWWLHRYIPLVPDMDFWQSLAVVIVGRLITMSPTHTAWTRKRTKEED